MGKKIKVKKLFPWISYSGSCLQQNYGESIDQHGYLLWDIKSRNKFSVEFNKLTNPHPYVTIQFNGTVEGTIEDAMKYPDGSRFRIRSKTKLAQQDVNTLTSRLSEIKHASEVTFKVDYTQKSQADDERFEEKSIAKLFGSNLHNVTTLIDLMKEYYSDIEISDEEWVQISEILQGYTNSSSVDESVSRGMKWSPKLLKFNNVYGFGRENSIDFEKMSGIVGIFGNNRSGKSSIIGTLLWTLFNTSDRGKIKNYHIINTRKTSCDSSLVFSCNGNDYVVERQAVKNESKYSSDASVTSLNFSSIDSSGKKVDLNGTQRLDTEKSIRRLIGSFEDFLLMSVATQDDMSKFVKQGSTHRARILAKFLDLDVLSTMHEMTKSDIQALRAKMSVVNFCNWDEIIKKNVEKIAQLDEDITEIESSIVTKKMKYDELRAKFTNSEGSAYIDKGDIEKQKKRVQALKNSYESDSKLIDKTREKIEEIEKKIDLIVDIKKKNNIAEMKKSLKECSTINQKLITIGHKLETETNTFNRQKDSIKILKSVPCGDNFPTCKFIRNSYRDKQKIDKQAEKIKSLNNRIKVLKRNLKTLNFDSLQENVDKLERLFSAEESLTKEKKWKEKESTMIESNLSSKKLKFEEASSLLKRLEETFQKKSNSKIDSLKIEIDSLKLEINLLEKNKLNLSIKRGQILETNKKLKKDKKFYDEHKRQLRLYELIMNSFSKKGIPNRIIAKSLPLINEEIEKVLQGIVDFTIELEIDEDGNDLDVFINYGDSRRVAELCSGMEKMIGSVAIRVALCNVSSLPKSDIFIIDEGFGSLDGMSLEASNRLLVELKKYFKSILIISHIDTVKDVADQIIEITKKEKNSSVVYQ